MSNNLERTNSVYYQLYTRIFGNKTIQEPKGYNNDRRSFERDKDSRGITVKTDIELEFYGNGADFLATVYNSYGGAEKVLLTKYEKSLYDLNERWELKYVQELDMYSYDKEFKTGKVTVKATEGGLYDDIKSRSSDDYDLVNQKSADGVFIGEIKTNPFQPQERGIFIESLLRGRNNDYKVVSNRYKQSTTRVARSLPMEIVYESDGKIQTPHSVAESYNNQTSPGGYGDTTNGDLVMGLGGGDFNPLNAFYLNAIEKKEIQVKLNGSFKIDAVDSIRSDNEEFGINFYIGELRNDDTYRIKYAKKIYHYDGNPKNKTGETIPLVFDENITLEKGDAMAFTINLKANLGDFFGVTKGHIDLYTNASAEVRVIDKTTYDVTVNRCIRPFDLFDRLIAKITGKTGLFRSSLFEEGGIYESYVVDNGFWARGFPDEITNDNDEKETIQFKTSFDDAFDAFNYIEPLAWFIDLEGNEQVLRLETAKHTQQNFIGINIAAVDELKEESSKPDYFSTVELGHKGSLEYEEINGLDEPNGISEYSTYIKRTTNKYSVISPYRVDSIGYELIRRKPFAAFPKEDTPRDKDLWMHDAKKIGLVYTHKLWYDNFSEQPKGIFDPDTAWNLNLSPTNRLFYGHGYSVIRGLYHFQNNAIRFSSSNANRNLVTKKEVILSNDRPMLIQEFENPRVTATKTNVTLNMTQEIEKQFLGYTLVNGKKVSNMFGIIKYTYLGQERYGRIVKLDNDDKAKLTMINVKI